MGDHDLLPLRRFGPGALADVRFLVPPPGGSVGEEVTIAGRAFTLGAVYAPRRGVYGHTRRRLLGHVADSPLPGGKGAIAVLPPGKERGGGGGGGAARAGGPGGGAPQGV